MVYAIASGDYEEYHIDYIFINKEKRDEVLELLNEGFNINDSLYHGEDFETSDDIFQLDNVKHFYYARYIYRNEKIKNIEFKKGNDLQKQLLWKKYYEYRILDEKEIDIPVEKIKEILKKEHKKW